MMKLLLLFFFLECWNDHFSHMKNSTNIVFFYFALLDAVVDMDESFVLVLEFVVLLLWLLSLSWFLDDGIE